MFPPCVALLLSSLVGGNVLVVSPTGTYTQIQDAVNAANDGDLVLVHTGTYDSFTVQAMSLTVVADTGAAVTLQGGVTVSDLASGQRVCLIGLHALGENVWPSTMPNGLLAQQNLGSLRCERCDFSAQMDGVDAVLIQSSSDVSFVGCQLTGGEGPSEFYGGAGARLEDSMATFFDCTLHGGEGWTSDTPILPGGNGGEGLNASGCTIFSSGSSFTGGNGGFGQEYYLIEITIPEPGYGGAGIDLAGGSLMSALDCLAQGGAFGDPIPPWSAPAVVGDTFTTLSGTKRTMTSANPVRELTNLSFALHGAGNQSVYLLVGTETALQWDPIRKANFLLARPFRTLPVGATNGAGNLSVTLPLSDLGSGVQSEMFYVQPLFVSTGGAQQLGTPITLAALDQAF